jgi:signal transduction histidine kinase
MPLLGWFNLVLIGARAVLLPLVLFTLIAVTMVTVVVGHRRNGRQYDTVLPSQPAGAPPVAGGLDVETELRAVVEQLATLAAQHRVGLELAVQPGLTIRPDARGFREIVRHLLAHSIGHAPAGRVLLGAFLQGGRVHVAVIDDGSGAERAIQQAALRPAERLATLQGATLEIDPRAGQGTTLTLLLPASSTAERTASSIDAATAIPR